MNATDNIIGVLSKNANFTGIQADLVMPSSYNVANNGSDFFNFYIGFGDHLMEGGVSYSKKWADGSLWHKFLNNTDKVEAYTAPLTSLTNRVNLKLINNGNHTATLYINGNLVTTLSNPDLPATSSVKMVQGASDVSGNTNYSQTSFSNVQVRTTSNTWIPWDGSISYKLNDFHQGDMKIYSYVPLSTSIS